MYDLHEREKKEDSHIPPRPIPLAHNKIPREAIIPADIERTAREVAEVYVGKVVGPVLNRPAALAGKEAGIDECGQRGSEGEKEVGEGEEGREHGRRVKKN